MLKNNNQMAKNVENIEDVVSSRILSQRVSAKQFLQHIVVHYCVKEHTDLRIQVFFLAGEYTYQ